MRRKKIVFTGGGTAGHVMPNIAIMNELKRNPIDVYYIGSKQGIESELIAKEKITYYPIASGKLRRYASIDNFKDLFRTLKGTAEARKILKKIKPDLVFSKGGFVTVPVVLAARSLKIACFIHESDLTIGLANKIALPFAQKIFTSFPETATNLPPAKTKAIGSPIRKEMLAGNYNKGLTFLNMSRYRPILLVIGGSLGAKKINEVVREALPTLLEKFQVVHLCGKGNYDNSIKAHRNYRQFEFLHDELPDVVAASTIVITRGGANALFEFVMLHKPMLIIPLPRSQSRGDQILNAKSFANKKVAHMLEESELTPQSLLEHLQATEQQSDELKHNMEKLFATNALETLVTEIKQHLHLS